MTPNTDFDSTSSRLCANTGGKFARTRIEIDTCDFDSVGVVDDTYNETAIADLRLQTLRVCHLLGLVTGIRVQRADLRCSLVRHA